MAKKASSSGTIFRPHFKTHQSLKVGNWFKDHSIDAITVSSLSMAQQFAETGWQDITIAFPANLREIEGYNRLSKEINLNLLVDSVEVIDRLSADLNADTGFFIEIDTGYGRSGVHFGDEDRIKSIIAASLHAKNLKFIGFLTHSGDTYSAKNTEEIEMIYHRSVSELQKLRNNYPQALISVGDTPACSIVDDLSEVDELRPGNFVYYDLMQYKLGSCGLDDIAVSVACPVTGIYPDRNEIVIYGGAVHLSKESLDSDGKLFGLIVKYTDDGWTEHIHDTRLISLSQEHGIIRTNTNFLKTVKHGDLLGVLPVHSCLTVNLLTDQSIIF